jgi:hypothetical protein
MSAQSLNISRRGFKTVIRRIRAEREAQQRSRQHGISQRGGVMQALRYTLEQAQENGLAIAAHSRRVFWPVPASIAENAPCRF